MKGAIVVRTVRQSEGESNMLFDETKKPTIFTPLLTFM